MNGQTQSNTTDSQDSASLLQRHSVDPLLAQHKQWQTVHLFQVNIKDNPFHPLDITNGPWKRALGTAGGVLGSGVAAWAASKIPGVAEGLKAFLVRGSAGKVGETIGSSGFAKIGFLIDNASTISQNIDTAFSTPPQSFEDSSLDLSDALLPP